MAEAAAMVVAVVVELANIVEKKESSIAGSLFLYFWNTVYHFSLAFMLMKNYNY